jgi:hypothetical protein
MQRYVLAFLVQPLIVPLSEASFRPRKIYEPWLRCFIAKSDAELAVYISRSGPTCWMLGILRYRGFGERVRLARTMTDI